MKVAMVPFNKIYLFQSEQSFMFINYCSDGYTLLYPYTPDPGNPGMTFMKTSKQVKEENLVIAGVSCSCWNNT